MENINDHPSTNTCQCKSFFDTPTLQFRNVGVRDFPTTLRRSGNQQSSKKDIPGLTISSQLFTI